MHYSNKWLLRSVFLYHTFKGETLKINYKYTILADLGNKHQKELAAWLVPTRACSNNNNNNDDVDDDE